MNVSIIGVGYVGLVTGVCLAERGHQVICVDVDQAKVNKINQAIPTIYEKDLEKLLKRNVLNNLKATTNLNEAVLETDISLISVGTPFNGNAIDLKYIKEAAYQIGDALKEKSTYHLIVVKSTVVPGTTDEVVLPILEEASDKKAGHSFGVGMNPEFLREGEAIGDFMHPDRIVLGGMDDKSIHILEQLYSVFDGVPKLKTNNKTAEMIKYTSNSLFATMISFANEIANLCTAIGDIDAVEVMKGVCLDKRLSPILHNGERITPTFNTYLEVGCGFGGSCFPKDINALISHGKRFGRQMPLLDAVMQVNKKQPYQIIKMIRKYFHSLKGIPIAILGLAFKPGTDDIRESPAIPIIQYLMDHGAMIRAYDPVANIQTQKLFGNHNIVYCNSLQESLNNAKAVVLLTRWEEFNRIPELLRRVDPQIPVIDGRRMLDRTHIARYDGIGL